MQDFLEIINLQVNTHIGVYAWELCIRQPLSLDIHIPIDIHDCHDQLENTLDYDKLCTSVITLIESTTFKLIETVAEKVAQLIKEQFNVQTLSVKVCKPHAIKQADKVCITIYR